MKRRVAMLLVAFLCVLLVSSSGCVVALGNRGTDAEDIRTKIKELDERLKKAEEKLGIAAPEKEPEADKKD